MKNAIKNVSLDHFQQFIYIETNSNEDYKNIGRIIALMSNANLNSPYSSSQALEFYIENQLKEYFMYKKNTLYWKYHQKQRPVFYLRFTVDVENNSIIFNGCACHQYEFQTSHINHHLIASSKVLLMYLSKNINRLLSRRS